MRFATILPASVLALAASSAQAQTQTFVVTASGISAYVIDGVNDPILTLERGRSYRFQVSASGHPFWIKTQQVTGTGSAYSNGVTNNGDDTGNVDFAVPMDAPAQLFYICQLHSSMGNRLEIVNPTGVDPTPAIAALRIAPNPARGSVRFLLPSSAPGSIEVFDPSGRLLRRLEASRSEIAWDGRDATGAALAAGVYLVRAHDGRGRAASRRLLWLGR